MKLKLPFVSLILFMTLLVSVNNVHAQSYKQDTGYLLQKKQRITFDIP